MLLTWLFLPDTTGLDLKEQERRWHFIRAGREQDYHGVAVHPNHLSVWERWRGVGRHYSPALDYRQQIEEMRGEWEEHEAARADEKGAAWDEVTAAEATADDSVWSDEVSSYYRATAKDSPYMAGREKEVDGSQSSPERI